MMGLHSHLTNPKIILGLNFDLKFIYWLENSYNLKTIYKFQ